VVPIVASVEIWTTHFALGRKRWRAVRMRVIEVMFGFATFLAGIGGLALALLSRGILARPEQVLGRPADATGPGRRSIRGAAAGGFSIGMFFVPAAVLAWATLLVGTGALAQQEDPG